MIKTVAHWTSATAILGFVLVALFDSVGVALGLGYEQHAAMERAVQRVCMVALTLGALLSTTASRGDESMTLPLLAGVQVVLLVLLACAGLLPSGMVT